MLPEPDLQRDTKGRKKDERGYSNALSDLRAAGTTLYRIAPTSVTEKIFVDLERQLNNLLNQLDRELKNSRKLSKPTIEFIRRLVKRIENDILPSISTWSLYVRSKAEDKPLDYGPKQMKELYEMVKPIGKMLRDLPEHIPGLQ